MRPPAATRSIVCSMAATAPVASMTTGMPSPLVSSSTRSSKAGAAGDRRRAEIGGGDEPLRRNVGRIDLGAARLRDLDDGKPDRAGAEHQHGVVGGDLPRRQPWTPIATGSAKAASKSVRVSGTTLRLCGRRDDVVGETAFAVDADDGEVGAAIALADAAGIAFAAADEGIDDDARADGGAAGAGPVGFDDARDLVAADAGIAHIGVLAGVDVEVAGAEPGGLHLDQHLARPGRGLRRHPPCGSPAARRRSRRASGGRRCRTQRPCRPRRTRSSRRTSADRGRRSCRRALWPRGGASCIRRRRCRRRA